MRSVPVKEFLSSRERLGITRILGPSESVRPVRRVFKYPDETGRQSPGSLPPHAILVVSSAAVRGRFCKKDRGRHFPAARPVSCVALSSGEIPPFFQEYSERTGTPVFASSFDEWLIHSRLTGLLLEMGRRRVMVHGTLVRLLGRGVLLMGESGIGKTLTALAAMQADSRWVADDAVVLEVREGLLYGRGHARTRDWIALPGRGILRAEALLGAKRLLGETPVDLVVRLVRPPGRGNDAGADLWCGFAGVSIPCRELAADEALPGMVERLMGCV